MTLENDQGGFFQFPLCLLATREPMSSWLNAAFCYGVVEFIESTSDATVRFEGMGHEKREKELARARKAIGFKGGDADMIISLHRQAASRVNAWTFSHGNTFNVRLKTRYFYEVRDEAMLSEREFRVMVGLYSMIGPKSFAKCGWPMIQARAAGHLRVGNPKQYRGPVFSRWQIEQAVAELLDRKLVASVTYNRGERFWTHRLSAEELAAAVTAKKTRMVHARHERAALNAKTSGAIASAAASLITCRSGAGDASTAARPQHVPGTSPSTGASTSPSTLQESPQQKRLQQNPPQQSAPPAGRASLRPPGEGGDETPW